MRIKVQGISQDELLTPTLVSELTEQLAAFGIHNAQPVRLLCGKLGSLAVQISVSPRGETYLLKRHRLEKTCERIEQEETFARVLHDSGCPLVTQALRAADGSFAFSADRHFWTAYRFVESQPHFDWTEGGWTTAHALAAGKALRQFHLAAGNAQAANLVTVDSKSARQNLDQLGASVSCEAARLLASQVPESEFGLIHGDYHAGNLLFNDCQVVGLVDLDFTGPGWQLFDIAYGCLMFAGPWRSNAAEPLGQEFVEAFLAGYEASGLTNVTNFWTALELACHVNIDWLRGYQDREYQLATTLLSGTQACLRTVRAQNLSVND